MKKLKTIPKFKNEEEEANFWATHDSTEYVDWSKAQKVLSPNLKPTSRPISIRFPVSVLDRVKTMANRMDVPYQSLIKQLVNKGIGKNFK